MCMKIGVYVYEHMVLATKSFWNGCTDPAGVGLDL